MQTWLRRVFFAAALFALVMALLPQPPSVPLEPGDKVQHMMAFFTLGALAAAGWRRVGGWQLFVWLAVFGAAIEIFQTIPVLHRHGDPIDWVADMAAAGIALVLARGALNRLSRGGHGSDA